MTFKTSGKQMVLLFGDFIAAAYRTWGGRRAKELVRVAVNERLIEFRGRQRFVISDEYGEIAPT